MAPTDSGCFHCGLAIPHGTLANATVLGRPRAFCCPGCAAVAETIVASGFESYYVTRTSCAAPPPEAPPGRAASAVPGTSEAWLVLDRVTCSACLWLIEQVLRATPGVARADVNFATRRAQVSWDAGATTVEALIGRIRAVGYDAWPYDPADDAELERRERRSSLRRLFVSGLGAMQVMMYAYPAYVDPDVGASDALGLMRWASLLISAPVLAFSCGPFFAGAWRELRQRRLGLDTPLALGIAGAFVASAWATATGTGEVYFDSLCMLAFILLGVRHVELAARHRAKHALDPLLSSATRHSAEPGDVLRVAPGERVPADGIIEAGSTSVDESLLTGESRPEDKRPGDELVAGSVNLDQPVTLRVTRAGSFTRAAEIARLAERAAASRPRLVEASDRVARALTGAVIATALGAALVSGDPWIAVAVLVATCPCALALAAPIVVTRANAFLLSSGVLVTRSSALEALGRLTDVILDKTGTLTEGRLRLVRFHAFGALDESRCTQIAAALEATSRHPIARVFPPGTLLAEEARYEAGAGIEARIEGVRYRIGSAVFCGSTHAVGPVDGRTVIYLSSQVGCLAAFELEDSLRPEAAALVRELKACGVRVQLLSGDAPAAAAAAARAVGIERSTGAAAPQDKLACLRALQAEGRIVAMVGD
ncbi:MAG: heavy metal translocating P-type ATPase, partial [Betaproteobacteria bacterium]|nr:heavy metal translocating P-type ATPase [Betaproteobacteria bacterium]